MTTTSHPETQVVADPNLPTIRIVREFDAPVEAVFRAHTDPELVRRWLGPRGLTMTIERFDAQTGGAYRYVHTGDDGVGHRFYGSFHEVRPNDRIVQTFTYEGWPNSVSVDITTFEDIAGRTRLTSSSVLDSIESRDGLVASGMESGVVQGYEQLDELLAAS